jgi:hypothetical protein
VDETFPNIFSGYLMLGQLDMLEEACIPGGNIADRTSSLVAIMATEEQF